MELVVTEPSGDVVATVTVAGDGELARNPGCDFSHVVGTFQEGPAFERIRDLLGRFHGAYAEGQQERAVVLSEELDRFGLAATDPDGRVYSVFNLVFEARGLLFGVTRRDPLGIKGHG